jgi:hypothetical protein
MLNAQHKVATLNDGIKASVDHLKDVNRQTADDAAQFNNMSGAAVLFGRHVADINQNFDNSQKLFNTWTGDINGVMTSIDLTGLHAAQALSAIDQQLSHIASDNVSITVDGITHSATGRYATSPMLSYLAEDEPEWVLPQSKVPAWARPLMFDMLAGHAPARPPTAGGAMAMPMPMPMPVATTGGGGGTVIAVGTVYVQGVQDVEGLWRQLRTIALDKAASGDIPGLWSSPARGHFG